MVAEQFVVADIVGQDLERLVPADLLHLEHRRALSRRLGQEARPQRVPGNLRRIIARGRSACLDILTKVNRAAMAASLETRVPLLDHRVVEQVWRTPLAFKVRDSQGKWTLRQILYRYVPRALIERPKAGFAIPIGAWLRGPLRDWAEVLLSADARAEPPTLDSAAIRARWGEHLAGTHDRTASLWGVLMSQAWAREWHAR